MLQMKKDDDHTITQTLVELLCHFRNSHLREGRRKSTKNMFQAQQLAADYCLVILHNTLPLS